MTNEFIKYLNEKYNAKFKNLKLINNKYVFLDNNNKQYPYDDDEDAVNHLRFSSDKKSDYIKWVHFKTVFDGYIEEAGKLNGYENGKHNFTDIIARLEERLKKIQANKPAFGKSKKIQELPLKRLKADLKFLKQKSI
jgi:hypothetical protein